MIDFYQDSFTKIFIYIVLIVSLCCFLGIFIQILIYHFCVEYTPIHEELHHLFADFYRIPNFILGNSTYLIYPVFLIPTKVVEAPYLTAKILIFIECVVYLLIGFRVYRKDSFIGSLILFCTVFLFLTLLLYFQTLTEDTIVEWLNDSLKFFA